MADKEKEKDKKEDQDSVETEDSGGSGTDKNSDPDDSGQDSDESEEEDSNEEESESDDDSEKADDDDKKKEAASSSRRSSRARSTGKVQSVVPLWLYVVSIVIVMGFAVALFFKMQGQISDKEDNLLRNKTNAEGIISGKIAEIRKRRGENDKLSQEIAKLKAQVRSKTIENKNKQNIISDINGQLTSERKAGELAAAEYKKSIEKANAEAAAQKKATEQTAEQVKQKEAEITRGKVYLAEVLKKSEEIKNQFKVVFNAKVILQRENQDLNDMVKYLKEEKIPELKRRIEALED